MINTFETGAVFKLVDEFSRPGAKLFEVLERAEKQGQGLQVQLDKLGLGPVVKKMERQWEEINKINQGGVDGIIKGWGKLDAGAREAFGGVFTTAQKAFADISAEATAETGSILRSFSGLKTDVTADFAGMKTAAGEQFTGMVEASRVAAGEIASNFARASTEAAAAAAGAASSATGASLRTRRNAAHVQNNRGHGGLHFRGPSAHIPGGGHIGFGQGDGLVPLVGGLAGFIHRDGAGAVASVA